ncbi:AAA family ATPase [Streptomyces sp. NPDC059209]|uniref:AAA family ATPase n=1 Tax=Streptomyces sp. NPDC059209 TaxID=3346769 RepID=UPI00368DDEC4
MIVWVNGAFGAGKTTLTTELHSRRPDALLYDPEPLGIILREIVDDPTGDFQDLRLWRRQLVSLALGLLEEYERPLLVPMTLVDPVCMGEVFGALAAADVTVHHFFLDVPADVLYRRLDARAVALGHPEGDPDGSRWAKDRVARCVAAAETMPVGTVFLDGERPTPELADEVLKHVPVPVRDRGRGSGPSPVR